MSISKEWPSNVHHRFQRRQSYARSVASNSIAGFVVGLGDRHAHNILIDKRTAEVIHIDLGIAFDQGKLLSTPELVPFRLTRDIGAPCPSAIVFQKDES